MFYDCRGFENEDIGEVDDEKYIEIKRFVFLLIFFMLCLFVKLNY